MPKTRGNENLPRLSDTTGAMLAMNAPDHPAPSTTVSPATRHLEAFPRNGSPETAGGHNPDWGEVLESIHDAIFVHEVSTGRILHANAAACRMYGYIPATLMLRSIADLSEGTPPHSEADARRWLEACLTHGPQVFEWRARAADGHLFWVEVALCAGPAASPERCFATVRDIGGRKALAAERERTHAALRQSEERFRLLLGRMPTVAVQGCGPDGTVRYWNEASERLYGYTAAEAVGRSLVNLIVPPPLRDEMHLTLHQMMATGHALPPAELQLQRKDGSLVPVFASHTVVNLPGLGPELYRLDFDLSERKRAEAERLELERRLLQSQKLESLGVLAGGIAHDFNNLLTGVLGNLELARTELAPDDRTIPLIDDAIGSARLAANLTHQMLAYTGRTRFEQRPVDLNAVVRDTEPLLHAAAARRAALQLFLDPELPEIEADPNQLGQILVNLVTNAAEAIVRPPGTVEVRTGVEDYCDAQQLAASRLEEKPAPQRFVFIEVADTGCGMDAVTAHRVFDPFFSTKFAGRGLGLPVVMGIVRAHHGALFVDSLAGKGSVVRVLLPLARPPAAAAADMVPSSGELTARNPAGVLLVVDDEESVRRLAQRMGQRLGLEVVTAVDGEEAVGLCQRHGGEFFGAIIDLTMPGMNGVECLRELQKIRPGLPAALSSGFAPDDVAGQFGTNGFRCFLQKPFAFEQFARALKQLGVDSPQRS